MFTPGFLRLDWPTKKRQTAKQSIAKAGLGRCRRAGRVFAQSLMPHRIGMISGVFFGLLFGFGGLGAALIGALADRIGIQTVYQLCAFLPAMGLLTVYLPDTKQSPGG